MTIATISDGKMMDLLHSIVAVGFFIFWTLALFMIRSSLEKLKKINPQSIDSYSLYLKNLICLIMFIVLIYCGIKAIFSNPLVDNDKYVDIIEWVIFFGFSAFIWTFSIDWQN